MKKLDINKNLVLETYISNTNDKRKLENLKLLIDRFNKLPVNHQVKVIESLEKNIEEAIIKEELSYGLEICQTEGHTFSGWQQQVTEIRDFDEAGWCEIVEKYTYEKRKCLRCGIEETKTNYR